MIYLLHGPDTVSSRNFLLRLKKQYSFSTTIDVKKLRGSIDLPTIQLFEEKSLLILENSLPKNADKILPRISCDVVIWLAESLKPLPNWVSKDLHFQLYEPSSSFKLADLVFSGQEKKAQIVLAELMQKNTPLEIILGGLISQLRSINLILEGETQMVSKSSFVLKKTKEISKFWTFKKLKKASRLILKADLMFKKGLLSEKLLFPGLVSELAQLAKD